MTRILNLSAAGAVATYALAISNENPQAAIYCMGAFIVAILARAVCESLSA